MGTSLKSVRTEETSSSTYNHVHLTLIKPCFYHHDLIENIKYLKIVSAISSDAQISPERFPYYFSCGRVVALSSSPGCRRTTLQSTAVASSLSLHVNFFFSAVTLKFVQITRKKEQNLSGSASGLKCTEVSGNIYESQPGRGGGVLYKYMQPVTSSPHVARAGIKFNLTGCSICKGKKRQHSCGLCLQYVCELNVLCDFY